ncbi:MAG: immunoglobulin domain-containing protein [Synergistaceae bacterium]|nr:immunoglobulin domain-containing protein [Synergistaceae bacterium]
MFATVSYKIEYDYMNTDNVSMDVTVWGEPDLSASELSSSDVRISATEGTAIETVTITATPSDYLTWTTSGTLPAGLTGSSSGSTFTISGTPSAATSGDYTFTVTASHPEGSASAVVTVNVKAPEAKSAPELSG